MMALRYYSEFRDRLDVLYRIEIHQENGGIDWPDHELVLASNPIDIEWDAIDKVEPVQGSSATLNLISMSDREFADLYTIEPGTIRMDVYRNGSLYWSGMLDPEIFEEPYSYKEKYVTSLTFSDFGLIGRKEWDGSGIHSLREVIDTCIAATGIQHNGLVKYISTTLTEGDAPLTLDELFCLSDNFYDEESESMTLREVLDEALKPFALRLVQKDGRVYLYDLNAIHTQQAQRVVWASTDANLEADVVYNNVKVSFSPYADGVLIDGTLDHGQVLKDQPEPSGELIMTDYGWDAVEGFRIVYGKHTSVEEGAVKVEHGARIFRIDPEFSGNKEAGVVYGFRPFDSWFLNPAKNIPEKHWGEPSWSIIKLKPKFIGAVPNPEKYRIKITLEVLFDVRYNPFESDGQHNEEENWKRLNNWCNYGYIPISLTLQDKDGNWLYSYDNNKGRAQNSYTDFNCPWVKNRYNYDSGLLDHFQYHAWLCYYDPNGDEGRKSSTGFGGWKTNRPIIGWYPDYLPSKFRFMGNGEYLPLPPINGYLHLAVYEGVEQFDNDGAERKDIWSRARWVMYKNPKVEIVKANGRDIDKEDIEDIAWLNKGAKESLDIDTIIGTMPDPVPSARGLLFRSDGTVYTQFHRAGHTERLERLLIGTVYSQYADRKHILSGTVELIPGFSVLTDTSEPGQYIMLSEVQHLREALSEIRMVQFEADSYESIEYKDE